MWHDKPRDNFDNRTVIAARLRALPLDQLERLKRGADALTDGDLAIVRWLRCTTRAEIARRYGGHAVTPLLPSEDRAQSELALATIAATFVGQEDCAATGAFLETVVSELHRLYRKA